MAVRLISLLITLVATLCSSVAYAQNIPDDYLNKIAALYKFADWKSSEKRDGIFLGSLKLDGWTGTRLRSDAGHMKRRFTRRGSEAVLIEAFVGDTQSKGQKQLLYWLAMRQSGRPADRYKGDGQEELGDISFVDYAGRIADGAAKREKPRAAENKSLATVYLVRGNVAVRVTNIDPRGYPKLDLESIARQIDKAIKIRPKLEKNQTLPRPKILKFVGVPNRVVAGQAIQLDFKVEDPVSMEPHLQWRVGGTGQGYVEQGKDGLVRLHTTKAGSTKLTLEVTGSTGTFQSSTILLQVLPRGDTTEPNKS